MTNTKTEHNIPKFISYQIFNSFIFFAPILVLYLQSKGLTMTQILTLQSIFAFGMVIMEVPTGAFADRYGKRTSLVLGSFFFALGLTIYGISSHFLQFIMGELATSIGAAFISGADSAFLHETLKSLNRDDEYTKITGRTAGLTHVAGAMGSVMGGFIGTISLGLTFILSSLSTFIASLIGLSFAKPMITLEREEKTTYLEIIKSSISVIHQNKTVLWLILFFSVFNGLVWVLQFYIQPYLQLLHVPLYLFGLIYAIFAIVTAVGAMYTDRFDKAMGNKSFFVLIITTAAITFLLGTFPSLYIFPLWLCFNIFVIMSGAITSSRILKIIPTSKSATILSFQSLARRLLGAVMAPLVGMISDRAGMPFALQVIALTLFSSLGLLFFLKQKFMLALQ